MEITLQVRDITGKYTLRQHVGEGQYGDTPIKLASALPSHSPIVQVDGKMFVVSIHDIAKAICEQVIGSKIL